MKEKGEGLEEGEKSYDAVNVSYEDVGAGRVGVIDILKR